MEKQKRYCDENGGLVEWDDEKMGSNIGDSLLLSVSQLSLANNCTNKYS